LKGGVFKYEGVVTGLTPAIHRPRLKDRPTCDERGERLLRKVHSPDGSIRYGDAGGGA
jgi:hypothetical protein